MEAAKATGRRGPRIRAQEEPPHSAAQSRIGGIRVGLGLGLGLGLRLGLGLGLG